jgi:hypothetical protein
MTTPSPAIVFITHAAPQDNEFSLWLNSKLAIAGYNVWVDRQRLRGGDDSWVEINRVLRHAALKQIVAFSKNVRKPGVQKELAIGDVVRRDRADPAFIIPIRIDDVAFSDAPPEFLRANIIDAYPNWHDCLKELFETLDNAGVPRSSSPDAEALRRIVEAREEGRRFVINKPEKALTNWFPITPPASIRYYRFEGMQEQMKAWMTDCRIPVVSMGRLAAAFADPPTFAESSSFQQTTPTAYEVPFGDFVGGENLGPYAERSSATNDVVNLLRQYFNKKAKERGLLPVEFANKDVGWFFPDGLLPGNRLAFEAEDGRRIRRATSGKFKTLRWHVCVIPKPRVWPELVYRVHANVVLSTDGKTPIPGDQTHKRRRRLTKSWWNDVWRDRLLAAMHFLADENKKVVIETGDGSFEVSIMPLLLDVPVSYEAVDPPLPSEEDDEGNIVPTATLDDQTDDTDQDDSSDKDQESDE